MTHAFTACVKVLFSVHSHDVSIAVRIRNTKLTKNIYNTTFLSREQERNNKYHPIIFSGMLFIYSAVEIIFQTRIEHY